jgi:hypothetical protein
MSLILFTEFLNIFCYYYCIIQYISIKKTDQFFNEQLVRISVPSLRLERAEGDRIGACRPMGRLRGRVRVLRGKSEEYRRHA